MFQSDILQRAAIYAINCHGDQKRDFEKTPYIVHPIRVGILAAKHTTHGNREFVNIVGLFHDILEDTKELEEDMRLMWGKRITDAVVELTKVPISNSKELSPVERFRAQCREEAARLGPASHFAKVVKVADIYDNVTSLGPTSAPTPWAEKMLIKKLRLMPHLSEAAPKLWDQTQAQITTYLDEYHVGWKESQWATVPL